MSDDDGEARRVSRPRRGTNLPQIADFNQSVILDAIRTSPSGIARVDIARSTGLAPQTITNITRRLLDGGLIQESGSASAGRGRPSILLTVRPGARHAIGVHIDPAVSTLVMVDLAGSVTSSRTHPTPMPGDPDAIVTDIAEEIESLIADSGVDRAHVLGIGVASPGPLDQEAGVVISPPLLPGWHNVPLRDAIANRTNLPVMVGKDVLAAAEAHLWRPGTTPSDAFAFIYLGAGVAAAVVLHGEVIRGQTGNAGHSGHLVVDGTGPVCSCGKRGCMGTLLDARAVMTAAVEAGVLPTPDRELDWPEMLAAVEHLGAAARAGDPRAFAVIEAVGRHVGMVADVLAELLGLDTVIVGGPLWHPLRTWALPAMQRELRTFPAQTERDRPVAESSPFGPEVAAVGAACAVLNDLFAPHPSSIPLR